MYNTKLWRVTFDTNPDDCNLSCIMCEDHSPYSKTRIDRIKNKLPRRRMPISLIEQIFGQAKHLGVKEIIPSTMGEPLIYPDFERILALCHHYNIKLNLTTNGTFPKKGVKTWAKLIVPITSDVKISWNGASKKTQELIMKNTSWERVLDNLKEFITIRDDTAVKGGNYCSVTLQLTFMQSNVEELHEIVKLGIDLGVDRIKGHQLWTHGFSQLEQQSLRRDAESIQQWNKAVTQSHNIANNFLLPNKKKIKLVNFDYLTEDAIEDLAPGGSCPFLGKEAWVAFDGRFNPCCAPDKERRELGYFGNLNENTLEEILQSRQYQDLSRNYMKHAVCKKCNMRQPSKQVMSQKREEVSIE